MRFDLRRHAPAAVVLLAQAALLAVVYPSPARSGFVADPWVVLESLRRGLLATLARPLGYHWQPLAYAWVALLRSLVGERPGVFQWVNLAQLLSVGFLTYALGRRVSGETTVGFVASLLYLGSAAYYEASYWPLAGNMHLLGAQLYVLALVFAWDTARGRWPRGGPWLVAACALAAVLAHPAMATVVPVAALTLWLVSRAPGGALPPRALRLALLALGAVALAALGQRAFAKAFATAGIPMPGWDAERLRLIATAIAQTSVLRGSTEVGARLVDGFRAFGPSAGVAVWIGAPLLALAAACVATRSAGLRVLAAFYALHVFGVGFAAGLPSRQVVLVQVPVALLTAWALHAPCARLARVVGEAAAPLARLLPAVTALLMVAAAIPDHRLAARLTHRAGDTTRALYREVAAAVPRNGPARRVLLVNAPLVLFEHGIGTPVLRDGAGQIPQFASSPATSVELRNAPLPGALPHLVEAPAIGPDELRARAGDPASVVLAFGEPPRLVRRLHRADLEEALAVP